MILSHNLKVLSLFSSLCLPLSACNSSIFTASGLAGKRDKSTSIDSGQTAIPDTAMIHSGDWFESLAEASFEDLRTVSMSNYIAAAKEKMSNDPVVIQGQTFFNLKDFTDRHETIYQKVSTQYATVGDFFDAFSIASLADILPENIESGYQKLANSYESGELDDFLSDASINGDAVSKITNHDDLALGEDDKSLKECAAIALLVPRSASVQFALLDNSASAVAQTGASEFDKHIASCFANCNIVIDNSGEVNQGNNAIDLPTNINSNNGFHNNSPANSNSNSGGGSGGDGDGDGDGDSKGCSHGICLVD